MAVTLVILVGVIAPVTAQTPDGPVTFTEHVAPILYNSCTTCHRPGQVGPMSLLTYQDARPWAQSIRGKVSDRTMPPWHADPQIGTWANDRSLTDDEMFFVALSYLIDEEAGDTTQQPP